jgi:hypothetical protein
VSRGLGRWRPLALPALVALCALLPVTCSSALAAAARGWPQHERYNRAMHHASSFVRDPLLHGADVMRDEYGAPLSLQGSFGTVYRLKTHSGREVAFRVFHPGDDVHDRANHDDWQTRYLKVSRYLNQLLRAKRLPSPFVQIQWVPKAIEVEGRLYPAMKMPWIQGRTLDEYISVRLGEGRAGALKALASKWRRTIAAMQKLGIAHGDLHHRNILMERQSGTLRIIDYDAMFVPALKGTRNLEVGDANYQHPAYHYPKTRERPYDAKLDHFSSIVIYLSLVALAENPSRWTRFHGDHRLLFQMNDYLDPAKSAVFQDLQRSPDRVVSGLARRLAEYCFGDPHNVPSLETALAEIAGEQNWYLVGATTVGGGKLSADGARSRSAPAGGAASPPQPVVEWWRDGSSPAAAGGAAAVGGATPPSVPAPPRTTPAPAVPPVASPAVPAAAVQDWWNAPTQKP